MKLIDISTHKFPNTFAMVDDSDFDWLNQWKWCPSNYGYVVRYTSNKNISIPFLMHRVIMGTPKGMDTDHINGVRLDNRRENLRICTRTENIRNKRKRTCASSSKYKGVSLDKKNNRFRAQIQIKHKHVLHLGYFDSEVDAARAYDNKAIELFGEFAKVNF